MILRVHSVRKSGFEFSNPDFGFPNKKRNPRAIFGGKSKKGFSKDLQNYYLERARNPT